MTVRYRNPYGPFYSLSIIVSDFISIISFENKAKSGKKLLRKKKKNNEKTKKKKNHLGRIYVPFLW